jgi:tetratricopeptide (TPR) repeat protein
MYTIVMLGGFEFGTPSTYAKMFHHFVSRSESCHKNDLLLKEEHFNEELCQLNFEKLKFDSVAEHTVKRTEEMLSELSSFALCGEFFLQTRVNNVTELKIFHPSSVDKSGVSDFDSAVVKRREGDYKGALVLLDRVIERNARHSSAFMLRGKVFLHLNDSFNAAQNFSKAIELRSMLSQAYIGRYLAMKNDADYKTGLEDLDQAVKVTVPTSKTFVKAKWHRGLFLIDNLDFKTGIEEFTYLVKLSSNPKDFYFHRLAEANYYIGTAHFKLGNKVLATKHLKIALEQNPSASVLAKIQLLQQAISFDPALNLKPIIA